MTDESERLRSALDAAGVAVWEWDIPAGRITWRTHAAGWSGSSTCGDDRTSAAFCEMIHPEDRAGVLRMIDRAIETGEEYVAELRIRGEDGVVRWMSSKGRVVYDEEGRPARMIGISIDVSERKRMERDLREEQQRSARLEGVLQTVRTLQHEINNPLQVICGMLDLLPIGLGEIDEKSRHRLALLKEATGRIMQVVQGMGRLIYVEQAETVSSPVGEMLVLPKPSCGGLGVGG